MTTHPLVARPLAAAAFAPYGTVLQAPAGQTGRPINSGTAERFDLVPDLHLTGAGGRATLALFRAQARRFPLLATEMERHALGSQSFLPMGVLRFVLVVAPAGPSPSPDRLAAFISDGHQGVTLAPGTWHHALLAVDGGDFAVVERSAETPDCELAALDIPVTICLPAS